MGAWLLLFVFISPLEIVEQLGVEQTYLAVFLLACLTGVSTLTSASFYASVATFAAGGADPIFLGLAGGTGAFLSNTLLFFILRYGKHTFRAHLGRSIYAFEKRMERLPRAIVYLVLYVYTGFAPLPDDIAIGVLALSPYRYVSFAPFLLAGDITIVILISYLVQGGSSLF